MKQHERTHKNSGSGSNSDEPNARRSKAALTREAQKNKQVQKSESMESDPTTQSSLPSLQSPLSEVTSAAPSLEAPIPIGDQQFYPTEPVNQVLPVLPIQAIPENVTPNSLYPPITEEALMAAANALPPLMAEKPIDMNNLAAMPMPPPLIRGFSDLDTLAQAAETFDPYYQPTM